MSVNQAFKINTRDAVLGQIYGLQASAKVVDSWELEGAIEAPYASILVRTGDRKAETATAANVTGDFTVDAFAIRQARQEQDRAAVGDVNGSDNNVAYAVGDTVPAMRFGCVQALAGTAIVRSSATGVYYNPLTHAFTGVVTAGYFLVTNAVFDSSAAATGDIVRVRILTIA